MKTLADFIATRKACADLGTQFGAEYFDKSPRAGFIYAGDCYIEREDDGTFYLLLYREEYRAATLAELEPILYAWAIAEFPDEFDIDSDVHAFICELQDSMELTDFAKALIANRDEQDAGTCHMHDYCDANQCALNVSNDNVDAAGDLYNKARPVLRGKE
jgi:hypothetical protein